MSTRILLLIVTTLVCGSGCQSEDPEPPPRPVAPPPVPASVNIAKSELARTSAPNDANVARLVAANRAFAFDLFHQLIETNPGQNLVVAPHSISAALAMAYAGARAQTAEQLRAALHFDLDQSELHEAFNALDLILTPREPANVPVDSWLFKLNVKDSLWAQRDVSVEPAFLDTLALHYGESVFLTDFATNPAGARVAINDWVSSETDQLVSTLVLERDVHADTQFVLADVTNFDATWLTGFSGTKIAGFVRQTGPQKFVRMMQTFLGAPTAEGDNFQAISLRYLGSASLIIIMPDRAAFAEVEAALRPEWFERLEELWVTGSVDLGLPRLDFKMRTSLEPALRALGVQAAFDGADFSGITTQAIALDDVIHESGIRVGERGTEALRPVATEGRTIAGVRHLVDRQVTFNHPFLFAVIDEPTGEILFMGRVLEPVEEGWPAIPQQ